MRPAATHRRRPCQPPSGEWWVNSGRARDGAGPLGLSPRGPAGARNAALHDGGGQGGLLQLNPVDEAAADYWNSAPTSHELGVADLFFVDSGDVKVEG